MNSNRTNVALVGAVSAGKTTLVNSLFVKQYGNMKIKRTTMVPQIYHEMAKSTVTEDEVRAINEEKDNEIREVTERGISLSKDRLIEIHHNVPKVYNFVKLPKGVDFSFHDIPGMNDARTKELYFEYIEDQFGNYDIIIFMIDINSAMNTSDEVDILNHLLEQIKLNSEVYNKEYKLVTLVNKCDDMFINDDGDITLNDEHEKMFRQATTTIMNEVNKTCPNLEVYILPISCENAYIYRMYKKNPEVKMDMKHMNKFGHNECGKTKWSQMTLEQRKRKIKQVLKKKDYEKKMNLSGFTNFRKILQNICNDTTVYQFLSSHLHRQIGRINSDNLLDINNDIDRLYEMSQQIEEVNKQFGMTELGEYFNNYIEKYMNDYYQYVVRKLLEGDQHLCYLTKCRECYVRMYELGLYTNTTNLEEVNQKICDHYTATLDQEIDTTVVFDCIDKIYCSPLDDHKRMLIKWITDKDMINNKDFDMGMIREKYELTDDDMCMLYSTILADNYRRIVLDTTGCSEADEECINSKFFTLYKFWNGPKLEIANIDTKHVNQIANLQFWTSKMFNKITDCPHDLQSSTIDLTLEKKLIELYNDDRLAKLEITLQQKQMKEVDEDDESEYEYVTDDEDEDDE